MSFDFAAILKASGQKADEDLDLLLVALAFAAPSHDGVVVEKYIHHVARMAADAQARYAELIEHGAKDDAATQLAALKYVLSEKEGYAGDTERYDDMQNADIMRVVDRRKGMPIALAILYIKVGRMNGWQVDGINFPGHFLCRIEYAGNRLIFDPFEQCKVMSAPDLRQLVKKVRGPSAELSADYYAPCSNRDTLIRLQNNIKLRMIEAEDYEGALQSVHMMQDIHPGEYRLWLDEGVLYAKTDKVERAIAALEEYIRRAPTMIEKLDAQAMVRHLSTLL